MGVGSRFRGNDAAHGIKEGRGAHAPSWRYCADWIPAYAGMTGCRLDSRPGGAGGKAMRRLPETTHPIA